MQWCAAEDGWTRVKLVDHRTSRPLPLATSHTPIFAHAALQGESYPWCIYGVQRYELRPRRLSSRQILE
jgi:hypothetical protein